LGEDPTGTAWTIVGKNAVSDLLTFQFDNGGLGFSRPGSTQSAAPDPLSTTQALVALASKYLPVTRTVGAMPTTCPSVATTTPSPTAVPTVPKLPATGAPRTAMPLLAAMAGFALVALGWRLRRRAR
jgi:hypothetical protein